MQSHLRKCMAVPVAIPACGIIGGVGGERGERRVPPSSTRKRTRKKVMEKETIDEERKKN
jgi:hypothetical protein